ncbi:hypothetical protein ACFQ44_02700 [Levilactobacillus lanxiensis]|uniref:Uncharacterized protein n=1 Tax=Levilactobacillus lanxiensis TaxID=2799568 RepID=A0ABW4D1X9_9LACO|nr:hypothetical protein [Levilactobacillus lanxiensis]
MQRLYGCVPLLNAVGSLMFLLIISLQPSTMSSFGVDFDWGEANVAMVAMMLLIITATAFAKQRQAKRIGLAINGVLIIGMTLALWHAQVPALISDYLWLWALIMIFNLALIGWGWLKLTAKKK